MEAPTLENTNLQNYYFFQKSTNFNCKYLYEGVSLKQFWWGHFWNP